MAIEIEQTSANTANVVDGDVRGWIALDGNRQTVTIVNDRAWVCVAMARKRPLAAAWRKAREIHPALPEIVNGHFGSYAAETGALTESDYLDLGRFARQYGRGWKGALRRMWDDDYFTWMRNVRNVLGPSGLARVKID